METEILTRLIWAAALAGSAALLYWLFNRILLSQGNNRRLGMERVRPGKPALLYFTTPQCAPCKTVQRPAIEKLRARMGDALQVIEFDASAELEIARAWNVMSVPTTYILDASGEPRQVNHGVASADKLYQQIVNLSQAARLDRGAEKEAL